MKIYSLIEGEHQSTAFKMAPSNIKINPIGGAICIVVGLLLFVYAFGFPSYFSMASEDVSMRQLLSASIVLARRGGDRVREIRRADTLDAKVKGETREGAKEFVSKGDMASHDQIYYGLAKTFPKMNVVSEEHEKKPLDFSSIPEINLELPEVETVIPKDQMVKRHKITVWIDPLDATQEYTEMTDTDGSDMLHFVTTMVCVAVDGKPIMGVIHKPFVNNDQGETTWAWVGKGHSENLNSNAAPSKDGTRVIVSRSHAGSVKDALEKSLGEVDLTPAGGAGYKVLEVIKGNQDAYVHTTLIKKWDICAGNAILNALNGHMTTLDGSTIDYKSGDHPKNEGGLLATTSNHDHYVSKMKDLKTT